MYPLLALDCAGAGLGLALALGPGHSLVKQAAMTRGQSEQLLPLAQALLVQGGLDWRDLRAVAVTRGPGSFTGIRLGLAAAKGLGLALSIPVLGVGVFEVYAAMASATLSACPSLPPLLIAIESKRQEIFVELRGGTGHAGFPECQMGAPDLAIALGAYRDKRAKLSIIGDAAKRCQEALAAVGIACEILYQGPLSPAVLAEVALVLHGAAPETLSDRPLYLRLADVTVPQGAKP